MHAIRVGDDLTGRALTHCTHAQLSVGQRKWHTRTSLVILEAHHKLAGLAASIASCRVKLFGRWTSRQAAGIVGELFAIVLWGHTSWSKVVPKRHILLHGSLAETITNVIDKVFLFKARNSWLGSRTMPFCLHAIVVLGFSLHRLANIKDAVFARH